ncbi:hypothetical protein Tco_0760379 [Tanacetum coccineum]
MAQVACHQMGVVLAAREYSQLMISVLEHAKDCFSFNFRRILRHLILQTPSLSASKGTVGAWIDHWSLASTGCLGGESISSRAPSSISPSKPPLILPYGMASSLGSGNLVGDTCLLIEASVEDGAGAGAGARTLTKSGDISLFLPSYASYHSLPG